MKRMTFCSRMMMIGMLTGVLAFTWGFSSVAAPPPSWPVPPPLIIDEEDGNTTVDARVGQYIIIRLDDPYYGKGPYGWEVAEIRGESLTMVGRTAHAGGWSGQDAGAPAGAYFRLEAREAGETTILLICTPPPGPMTPIHYEVTVRVWPYM